MTTEMRAVKGWANISGITVNNYMSDIDLVITLL